VREDRLRGNRPLTIAAVKPLFRGKLHQWAAWYAFGAGSVLVAMASTPRAAAAAAVYSLSLVALFAISAIYHRVQWRADHTRALMRRLDHASIFFLIAGTYTPVALLGIGGDDGRQLLTITWIGAAVGIAMSVFWARAPKALTAAVAVAVGWTLTPYIGHVRRLLSDQLWLIVAGGVAYTVGAVVYAIKKPDPFPRVFGYHEVFHALTLVGALAHFAVVVQIVRADG
jgi:hemolysin III